MTWPTCLSEFVNALRRSGLTELATTLAVAQKFNIKRPFPFHNSGTPNLPFPTDPLATPKTFADQPAPQAAKLLLLPNRFADNVCASLSRPGRCKNGRFPSKTSATQNGRSPTNAPKFPESYPTNLRRNRQNRCLCQPACLKRLRQPSGQRPNKTGLCLPPLCQYRVGHSKPRI